MDLLRQRSLAVDTVRRVLTGQGYREVETPVLNTVHGGASARPFRTYINAYGMDLTLRIAPELYLKRLLVAGSGPIFEVARNFRNEGADATHNPEFTALEAYHPFADYTVMRELTETMIKTVAQALHGTQVLPLYDVHNPDAVPVLTDVSGPWPVIAVTDAVSKAAGRRISIESGFETLLAVAAQHDVEIGPGMGPGAVLESLYEELVEPHTVFPTFYCDFPEETSPLTAPHRSERGLVERWGLVVNGMELGTAYSELTDPVVQRHRLTEQSLKAAAGDQVGYFLRYGGRAIVLARFVPIIRTYVPLVAGTARHPYRRFVGWNVLGGFLWVTIMVVAGSLLGGIPLIRDHVDLIAILIVVISVIPVALQILKGFRDRGPQESATGRS
ncbi:amino acid--tRNA ligase-related protein [Kocuria marina]|uniref:amino acid--tRNA ligase-related protein n=1 Tax=Kocuria marina TaxID=223184 RepID=UPI002989B3EC|nr:amino acid--tRNA ligase-related protein [Kocuria marina]